MKKMIVAIAALLSVFSIKALTKPSSVLTSEEIIKQIPVENLIATCGTGTHGGGKFNT